MQGFFTFVWVEKWGECCNFVGEKVGKVCWADF